MSEGLDKFVCDNLSETKEVETSNVVNTTFVPSQSHRLRVIKGGLGRPEVTCQSLRPSDPTQVPQAICEETDCVAGGVLCGGDVSGVK